MPCASPLFLLEQAGGLLDLELPEWEREREDERERRLRRWCEADRERERLLERSPEHDLEWWSNAWDSRARELLALSP